MIKHHLLHKMHIQINAHSYAPNQESNYLTRPEMIRAVISDGIIAGATHELVCPSVFGLPVSAFFLWFLFFLFLRWSLKHHPLWAQHSASAKYAYSHTRQHSSQLIPVLPYKATGKNTAEDFRTSVPAGEGQWSSWACGTDPFTCSLTWAAS